MPRISLKNMLSPKSDAHGFILQLIQELQAEISIEDNANHVLLGNPPKKDALAEAILNEEELIGWVKGDEKVRLFASYVNSWIQKESEKKKLGNEVLTLYQEVNMVFDFSEKLAETIGQENIATITLEEARQLIRSDRGVLFLWGEDSRKMDKAASFGEPIFNEERVKIDPRILRAFSPSEIAGDLNALKAAELIAPGVHSLIYADLKVKQRILGTVMMASGIPDQYAAADLKFLVTLALQSAAAIESSLLYEKNIRESKEREEAMRRIYEAANKFVPHEFIGSLGRSVITDIRLGDKVEKIVTVLFSDIRDYTTLSEQMTPDENFSFVCSFNERMGPVIRRNHGFINQYLGDAIMAIFPRNASDALHAAIAMHKAVKELNSEQIAKGKPIIKVGIGMHTGPLIMGITGDNDRLDAATISDTVNTASRLEGLTKQYAVNIIMSEASINSLLDPDAFYFRQLGLIQLKGKLAPVSIYECFNGMEEKDFHKKLLALPYFREGISEYFSKSFKAASDKFGRVLEIYPDDKTTKLFLGKAKQYLDKGIPENWTGVEEMQHK